MHCYSEGMPFSYRTASTTPQVLCQKILRCKYAAGATPYVALTYVGRCCVTGRGKRLVSVCGARILMSYLAFYIAFVHMDTESHS